MGTTDPGSLSFFSFVTKRIIMCHCKFLPVAVKYTLVKSVLSFGWGCYKVATVRRKSSVSHLVLPPFLAISFLAGMTVAP